MPEEEIKINLKTVKESYNKFMKWFGRNKVQTIIIIALLAFVVVIGVLMRLQNLNSMVDQATGQYVPQLELDAFYWLREASTILHMGALPAVDSFRAVPNQTVGYSHEIIPYVIADLYKFIHTFNSSVTLGYVDVIYPVIFFAIGVITFFFMVYSLTKSKVASIVSSAFLIVIPTYLYRTVSGFSDHDALGSSVFFLVLMLYTYILVWLNKKTSSDKDKAKKTLILSAVFAIALGFLTAFTIVSWGGVSQFIPMIVPVSFFILWALKTKDPESAGHELKKFLVFYLTFVIFAVISVVIFHFPIKDAIGRIITSPTSFLMGFVFAFIIIDFILIKYGNRIPIKNLKKRHIIYSILITGILGLAFLIISGGFSNFISGVITKISHPFGTDRLEQTVAEERQTFAVDWISQTETTFFWLFFAGAVFLGTDFSRGIKNKKRKIGFVVLWALFIIGLLLSRYSTSSPVFNGTSFLSNLLLFGSAILLAIYSINLYIREKLELSPEQLVLFAITITMLVAANTAAYVMSIVSPFACLFVGYLIFSVGGHFKRSKDDLMKMLMATLLIAIIIASAISFIDLYGVSSNQAKYTGIGSYGQQWDSAMAWVQNNTPVGSVFVHWWDYGYIVQYLGGRPTVADGGQFQSIYGGDEKIGRYVLTTPKPETALSFFKSMNVSYLLIDPTDLGKYPAYALIGSDQSGNDRYSSLPIMMNVPSQMQTLNGSTTRVYQNVVPTDQDIFYNTSQGQVLIPQGQAYTVGIIMTSNQTNSTQPVYFSQPQMIIYYNNQQIPMPLRYIYMNDKLIDFGSGYPGAAYVLPVLSQNSNGGGQIDNYGSVIYLSPKVFNSLFAQLYLMNDPFNQYPTIKLALSQPDSMLQGLKNQGYQTDFIYFNGFDGPIKIWDTRNIPSNINTVPQFYAPFEGYGSLDNLTFSK